MVNVDDYSPRDSSNGFNWLKFRTNLIDEPNFMQLPDQAKAVYFEVYLLAGKSDAFGLVTVSDKPATVQDIAWILRVQESELQNALDALQRADLVDLDNGVTIKRFAKEQGPSMADKREQWAYRQAKRRALANGETWTEPEPDAEKNKKSDAVKDLKKEPEPVKDLKTTTKTKSVTDTSRLSHDIVTRDNGSSSSFNEYTDNILSVWQKKTGKKASKSMAFLDMCRYWFNEQVTVGHVTDAIDLVKDYAEPNTPMYLREVVINLKNTGPQNTIDRFRELYKQQKTERGDE